MAISIKNREAETLLQEIQAVTRRGKSQIVLDLLRHEVARLRRSHQFESRRQKLESIAERYAARLPQPNPSPDEVIGYDENGLPR
ncbi:type II toxin-antitoxin system VapB family antitoxin [Thiohalocapsa sp. ML1]|jgi:antitoxin VapB|uniref:type II toxin-antitoxin system VapB family antitoxin n=1 Tax=Thiohalocapsa sp. ML1 TaxID=1431688 RepID=UPI00073244C0|nr:type II toxin-antitoxin system VapB family antitoxin [Thiohalocapsa sp. ML1]